jgi:hypothetical protein
LTEDSVVCETGGGFTRTEWSVGVNDGWVTLAQLVRRGRIGDISTEIEAEDDPHGVASGSRWVDRPAQVWYRRRTYVVAPIGTRFRKRVETPVRDPAYGVRFSRLESDFELYREGRLVSLEILAERAARRARHAARPEAPLPKGEMLQHLGALLSELGGESEAASTPPAAAPPAAPPATRRRRAVELTRPQIESTPKKTRFSRSG